MNLSIRLYKEAKFMDDKKKKNRKDFLEKNFPFTPNIRNKTPAKIEHFYMRLQDWMEHKHEKSLRYNVFKKKTT